MAWKILTSLTAVCLAAITAFSYLNLKELNAERELLEFANANRAASIDRRIRGQEKLEVTEKEIVDTNNELEQKRQELADTNQQNTNKEADIARVTSQLQQVQARVARLEEQIREIGSVDDLIATAQGLETGIQEAEATIASRQQSLAIATNRLADLTSTIQSYQELEGRQRSGRLAEDFQARIASVVPTWGFVILDRGNLAGAYTNATLDVRRGGESVGRLRIGNVEQQVAFADVLPGSFAEGDMPRPGDLVVPAAVARALAPDDVGGFGLPDMDQPPVDQPPAAEDEDEGFLFDLGDPDPGADMGADPGEAWPEADDEEGMIEIDLGEMAPGEDFGGDPGEMAPDAPVDGFDFNMPDGPDPEGDDAADPF